MPELLALCKWLEQTWVGRDVRESLWLFPAIETVHLLGMAALLAIVTVLDLRLLGWIMPNQRVSELMRRLLPWAWAAFAFQVVTGVVLFSSEAVKVYDNPAFQVKIVLILLAGAHALIFHLTVRRNVATWDDTPVPPLGAKIAGCISLLLWIGIVASGRFIGFT
jgi:hypothetical protein